MNKGFAVCLACGVLCLAGGGLLIYSTDGQAKDLRTEISDQAKEIQDLKTKLKESGVTISEAEVEMNAANASKAGLAVCEIQNTMSDASTSFDDHSSQIAALKKYFGDAVLCIPWFTGEGGPKWTFESVYDSAVDAIPVLWTCRDEKGVLLAYTQAVYHAKSDNFTDGVVKRTAMGEKAIPSEGGDMDPNAPVTTPGEDMTDRANDRAVEEGQISGVADDVEDPDDHGQEIPEEDMLDQTEEEELIRQEDAARGAWPNPETDANESEVAE